MKCLVALVGALLLAAPARAEDAGAVPSSSGSALAHPIGSAAHEEEDPGASKDEKAEHKEKRRSYLRRTKKALEEAVHANGKELTDEERIVIRKHWRWSMRLWRIRHLADVDKNKAAVAQVDALLAKADAKTMAELKELNTKAPSKTIGAK